MAAILSPSAKQQFFDNAGAPAANFKLYTYAANTLNPQATFTDRPGLVANTNPIILDARGEAIIYLTPGVVYDYVLKTGADVTVWTREDIVADAGDANAVTYQQVGSAVTRSVQDKLRESFVVNDFGATPDNSTDTRAPFLAAKAVTGSGAVTFGQYRGQPLIYKFNSLSNTDFNGMVLDVPQGMTLSLPSSSYDPLKNVRFERQTRLLWTDINCDYYPPARTATQRDKKIFIGAGDLRQQKLTAIAPNTQLRFLSVPINVSDTFSSTSPTFADSRSYSYGTATGSWYGGFISLRRGETYSASFTKVGSGAVGVMFRHSGGYSVLYSDPTSPSTALMWRGIKATGGAIATAQDVTFPGRGSYASYDPSRAVWGVTIIDNDRALITLNGRAVTTPLWISSIGDAFEVGFVWQPTAGGATCLVADTMIERNTDPLGRPELGEVRIFGDSTSEYLAGAWPDDFKDMLDHTFGVKVTNVNNFAVSATNSLDAVNSLAANGMGSAYYVIVATGTNDIQQGTPLATTAANISSIINTIQSSGRKAVIVLPYMWYGQAQAGARGQNATNYDSGAPYRARIAKLCADTGAILVDPTRELAEPKPSFLSQISEDPLVRDNIHQSYLGYKLYAWAISRAIASDMAALFDRQRDYSQSIPGDWLRNGTALGANCKVRISEGGLVSIQGNMTTLPAVSNAVMNLPRWARPEVDSNFVSRCNGTGNVIDLRITTAGDVIMDTKPASTTIIDFNNLRFQAAGS